MNSSASGKLATNPLEAKSYLVCKFYILLGDQYDAYPTLKHDNVDCMENCNYLSHTCFLKLEYLSLFWIFWYGVSYTFKWTQLMWIWVKVHQNKFTVKRCPTKWRSKLQGFFWRKQFSLTMLQYENYSQIRIFSHGLRCNSWFFSRIQWQKPQINES